MASVDQTTAECGELAAMMKASNEKVRAEAQLGKPLIQKVPDPLRSIENGALYFNPEIVAIGPYHRHDPQLQPMEVVKKAAAHDFCNSTRHSVEDFYRKIGKDILLLENQIPWVVLEALMSLRRVRIRWFARAIVSSLEMESPPQFDEGAVSGYYKPCHLLDLVRESYLGPSIESKMSGLTRFSLFSSAMELTEIGVRFRASDTSRFRDISFRSGLLFGWLSLPPIQIDDATQAVISNMVAFETCAVGVTDYGVGSYLSLLALLLSSEEDVKELRSKKMIFSDVSDGQALAFLKSLDPHLGKGTSFMQVLQWLNDYYNKKRVRIFVHKIIYRNFKFILAAASVIVFFVTILQTIFTMMVFDGCFIIEVIIKYWMGKTREYLPPLDIDFVESDLILFENQIPFFVLEELFRITVVPELATEGGGRELLKNLALFYLTRGAAKQLPEGYNGPIYHLLHLLHISLCVPPQVPSPLVISEKVGAVFKSGKTLIQRVPEPFRSIENGAEYFNPQIVAIGPYHRDDPQVQPTEEIKKAIARDFCNSTRHSVEEFYAKVGEVAGEARSCYADRFDDMISEKEFTDMMFFDGCFLLAAIAYDTGEALESSFLKTWMTATDYRWYLISRDWMLLENQIPWVVLEALMSLRPVPINRFVQQFPFTMFGDYNNTLQGEGSGHKPCHLLDLVHHGHLGPEFKQEDEKAAAGWSLFSSAMDLAEVGVRIRASKTFYFRDISFHRDLLFGRLSLPPIFVNSWSQVLIANMVAFELCSVDYGVSTYLRLLVLLINKRGGGREGAEIKGDNADRRTLDFFESLSPHLRPGDNFWYVPERLNDYYKNRRVRVLLHKFIYNNFKFILAATSAVIFFVTILQTIFTEINEKVRAETELRKTLIQKVPDPLRSIENGAEYFNPKIVAIGPYHRGDPQVQPMEEIKKAAACDFCNSPSHSAEEFYAKVGEVAGEARSCYADRFDDMISEKEFTDMMFFDGCFLLEVIALVIDDCPPYSFLSRWMTLPCWSLISRDLMLLENQIPWAVLEALMSLRPVRINQFVQEFPLTTDVDFNRLLTKGEEGEGSGRKPCHILDLMRDRYLGPKMEQKDIKVAAGMSLFSSATDLAEVGVRIRASKTFHFRDIIFDRDLLFGRLSLPPIVISGLTQVHIANMVALERCTVDESDYGVGSYLSVLALLMSGEEDVKELRLKRIMHSVLSDRQTLDFFESLSLHLLPRDNYRYVLQRLNDYYRKRRVRVILHKFIYKNFKFILAVTSAVIFFVTILQTIFTVYPRK
ncbi:UPF0481 protein [Ananas comosus]|uniref:UPF0481 protein n=1 Tax=Ananas comosus TaxID=4615 RepID=A0A199VJT6_ANACO|nr:UPF0481 protein [Ananas comosus]